MSESVEKMVAQLITMVGKVIEGQNVMQADIAGIKTEMSVMQADIAGIKTEVSVMQADIAGVKTDVAEINGKFDYLVADVDLLEQDNLQNKKEIHRIKRHMQA